MPDDERQPEEYSFEEAMESLESLVSSLEGERLPLEEMVQGYERGVKLLRVCRTRIESARQRVELITADLEGRGKPALSDFNAADAPEGAAGANSEDAVKRSPRKKSAAPATETPPATPTTGEDIRLF